MRICQEDCAQTILNKSAAGEVLNRISKLSLSCWRFYDHAGPLKKSLLFECQKDFTLITNKLLFLQGVGGSDIEGNSCTIVNFCFGLLSSRQQSAAFIPNSFSEPHNSTCSAADSRQREVATRLSM